MAFALIPVKELSQAKARLSSVLDEPARRTLALAMFRDVLAAALACTALEGAAAVTRDSEVLGAARSAGAEGMAKPGGLNEALTSAARAMARRGVERVVVIAADIPLATPGAIAALIAADADVAIVPSQDGGTNALVTPPEEFPFLFGTDSARRHLEAGKNAGLRTLSLIIDSLALDVDTPTDLAQLCERVQHSSATPIGERTGAAPNTVEALEALGLLRAATQR